jgi:hypothetical protein
LSRASQTVKVFHARGLGLGLFIVELFFDNREQYHYLMVNTKKKKKKCSHRDDAETILLILGNFHE